MKVNNNSSNPTGTVRGGELAKTGKASTKAKTSEAGKVFADLDSAKVEMSKDAQSMAKAKAIASKETDNSAKVAHLQKLIDSGQYKVDSEAVADKLVNEHLAMGD